MDILKDKVLRDGRQRWIDRELRKREDMYTSHAELNVFIGTWNVNDKLCKDSLRTWLSEQSDIYVIGLQEMDMSTESVLLTETPKQLQWLSLITSNLPRKSKLLVSKQLGGLFLMIFQSAHCKLNVDKQFVIDVKSTGVMSLANKGSIGAVIRIEGSTLCFINSHFAADTNMLERRNWEYQESRSKLFNGKMDVCDYVFWFGDLNYRINLPHDQVKQLLMDTDGNNNFQELLYHDQLRIEIERGGAFKDFTERDIQFQPSYKYDPGTNIYDSTEKMRTPSWCDRILYRVRDKNKLQVLLYDVDMNMKISDHKPVKAFFRLQQIKVPDPVKKQEVVWELMKLLDKYENDAIPDVSISSHSVEFNDLSLFNGNALQDGSSLTKVIEVKNVGRSLAKLKFIPSHQNSIVCPKFLKINALDFSIMPGDSFNVEITLAVDSHTLSEMNASKNYTLDRILILHVENGKDMFISVLVNCKSSSNTRPISQPSSV
ncbi:hypothetical protein MIR68_008233 [Amoeboaphelidium protococcarum]|nr:hypothetical protein MIR68_008233 [Amoeboaphelidium protococcarum]